MNIFNEDEYAYKIHFSNNFDCDSDSDNKSDFDDWYYKHKPPPAEIYDCDIVKIEPFTTVLYKKSISKVSSKVNANSQKKIKSKRSWGPATKNVSDLNHKTQVFSESNKPKREGTTLANLSGYQENKPNEIPKKKRNRKKKSQINKAELFDLSSIEWPTLGSVQSPLESKSDSIKKNVNSFQYNNKDTKVLTELSQKCDNNVPSETKRFISESLKNMNGKSITETRFLLLDEYEKQSFLKFPERLQNTPKLNNVNGNKVTYNSKENIQNTGKSKSQAKELPLFGNEKKSIVPNKNSKIKCKKSVKATKQPDHSALKRATFNLSSFEWPSLHSVTSSFTYKNNPQQISKNMELKKGYQTNTLRQSQSAHLFKDQINCSSIPAEVPQRQQQSKKKLKSQKSKPISDNAICSISNKSSVKDKHNKHGSLQLNEQMKINISQSYSNTNPTGFPALESRNGFWCLDNEKISIFATNQSCCKSSRKQSHKMLKSNHSCLHNEKLSSCSSKNIEKPKQSKVSTKINIQSIVKKGGSLNLASNEETLVQSKALQSRNGLFINTSESSMGGLHNAKSNEVAYCLSLLKLEKKDKPIDTSVNKEKPKKNKAPKQSATNSSPPDKNSASVSLDKNHNHILCNSTGCNEVEQFEKVNKSISSTERNSHLLNNVQPKENLATDTAVNGVQLTKRKKKKPNKISEFNLSPYDETEVSELKEIKQKRQRTVWN
ncbi:hypothetical protein RI129_002813 [Pyrocoelia pectoralis]|uniref:Uncharacterized protein n=1 Tax=Pyrocoelia pectoralis TaxID=417401 RepID=A0AAN7VMK5_9COLE